ncbi:MAG TPA: hypothetical protein VEX60_12145 [Pyrinomonadaceae bacterium]|nr:hypothetical protein [Pyrinomonadaceae bacterium]
MNHTDNSRTSRAGSPDAPEASPRRLPSTARRRRALCISFVALLFVLLGGRESVRAQQLVFNVPSVDILDRNEVYLEAGTTFGVAQPRFSSFSPRVVIGAGKNIEVGVNYEGNIQPGDDTPTPISTFKWRVAGDGDKPGWVVTVGDHLYAPARHHPYRAGNYAYAQLTRVFGEGTTRVTAGGYHFTRDVVAEGAQRAGGQFSVEHSLSEKLLFSADWLTGKHDLGYSSYGFSYDVNNQVTPYAGYSLGNTGIRDGNHFFVVGVGIYLNSKKETAPQK